MTLKFIHTSDRHYHQPGAVQANATVNNAIIAHLDEISEPLPMELEP